MKTSSCTRIYRIASQLATKHGSEAEQRIERRIMQARDAGHGDAVNLWCRVKWRTRLRLCQTQQLVFAA